MNYNNPKRSGFDASLAGDEKSSCPMDPRTHANAICHWDDGFDAGERSKKCNGIEIMPGDYTGCDMKTGQYPMGDCPACTGSN